MAISRVPGKSPFCLWQSTSITAEENLPARSSTTVAIWPAHSRRTALHRAAASGRIPTFTS